MGSNSTLSDDQNRALAYHHKSHYERALAAKKTADANLKNVCKAAKADGVSADDIKLLIDLETPEGEEKIRGTLNRVLEVSRWASSPVGTQFSFIDEPDRTPIMERAFEEGKVSGYKGETCSGEPYDGDIAQEKIRGWHVGQETLFAALDLSKGKAQDLAEEIEAKEAESSEKPKRGRPKGSKNKNGKVTAPPAPPAEEDEHAAQKAEDAKAFEEPFPASV